MDGDPGEWTVNLSLGLIEAGFVIGALQSAAVTYARQGQKDVAELVYYMSEDLAQKFNLIGGREAAMDLMARRRAEENDHD